MYYVVNIILLANFLPQIQEKFPDKSASEINLLLTIASPLIAPADIVYFIAALTIGYRPTMLFALVVFLVSNIVGALATNYETLLVCRILNGLGTSPTDALQFSLLEGYTFVCVSFGHCTLDFFELHSDCQIGMSEVSILDY